MEEEVDSDVERVEQVYSDEHAGIPEEDGKSFSVTYKSRKVEMVSQGVQTDPMSSPQEEQDHALMELQAALAKLDTHLVLANAERLRRASITKNESENIAEEENIDPPAEPPTTDLGPSLPATPSFIDNENSNLRLESATSDLATLPEEELPTPTGKKSSEKMTGILETSAEQEEKRNDYQLPSISVDTGDGSESDAGSDVGDESEAAQLRLASATNQLHSVGPPAIIKYIREHPDSLDLSRIAKMVLSSTDALKLHDESRASLYSVASNQTQSRANSRVSKSGKPHKQKLCQFCGKPPPPPASPLPSPLPSPSPRQSRMGRESTTTTTVSFADGDDLFAPPREQQRFCCTEYEQFILLTEMADEEGDDEVVDEEIDINPHAPFGSKAARRAAKERAAERQRERELERQKAAVQQANMFSFARQMKTIQYSLSSQKYMDEGWTMLPSTPPPPPTPPEEGVFEIEVNSTELQKQKLMHERFYVDGSPFLTLFPDGTGTCYYPSGNVAVHIVATEEGKYTYIAQRNACYDDLEQSGILGVFEPNGNVMCCHTNEKLRLVVNAHGGLELDAAGNRRKRWAWFFVKGHVHTPPFQPLCFALNKCISVRLLDQDNIALIFTAAGRSIRFNAGAKLKALKVQGHGDFKPDESENYLARKRKKIRSTLMHLHDIVRQTPTAAPSPRNVAASVTSPRRHRDVPRFAAAQKKPLPALGEQSKTQVVVN